MLVSFDNQSINVLATEKAKIRKIAEAGSDVNVYLNDNNGFKNTDIILIGALLNAKTEIAQINTTVTPGHNIQVDNLFFAHNPNNEVSKLLYDQVRLYTAPNESAAKVLEETLPLDVDQRYTDFEIADSTVGVIYFTLYNSVTSSESSHSSPFALTSSNKTVSHIKELVTHYYPSDLPETKFRNLLNIVVENIYAERNWRFTEKTATFTTVDGQIEYDIVDDVGITDFNRLVSVQTATTPLQIIGSEIQDRININPALNSLYTINEWAGKFNINVSGAEEITIKYHKTPAILEQQGEKTKIMLTSIVAFGILAELYLTEDTDLSDRFEYKYTNGIAKMLKLDEKDIEFSTLPEKGGDIESTTPNILEA